MTYLESFIAIGVKGLFHFDWLGAGLASFIGPQLGEGNIQETYGNPPPPAVDVNWGQIWQVFLTLPGQNSNVTHHPSS